MLFRSHHSSLGLPLIRITFPEAEQWKGAMVRPNRRLWTVVLSTLTKGVPVPC